MVAVFDTGFSVQKIKQINNIVLSTLVKIFGYASKPMAKSLVSKGGTLVLPGEGFFVKNRKDRWRKESWSGQWRGGAGWELP